MNWLSWILVIILATVVIILKTKEQQPSKPAEETKAQADFSKSYQKKFLLTKNEWYEYKKLQQYASAAGLMICPKVRLLDIIEPRKGEGNYMSLLGKVQSKHVDFVICDKDLHIKGILELDDNSHDRADRKERDLFVDSILQSVGYTVIHTRSITETTLDPITAPKLTPDTVTK